MGEILWTTFIVSAATYAIACLLFVGRSRQPPAVPRLGPRLAPGLLAGGAVLQLTYLILSAVSDARCPVFSLHSALGFLSLVGVVTYAVLSRGRRLDAIGGFVAASAVLFMLAARMIAVHPPEPNNRWLIAVHITSNLLGGGILLIAGCASAFYLWNEHRLKSRRLLGQGPKLPPLEALDGVVHRLLWIGLPLLTIGVLTGRLVQHTERITLGGEVRAVLSSVSWLLLLGVLALRQIASWRGRRPAYATLGGALGIFIVIALYVVRALLAEGL
jgi:ABC-type uncharacterized transport system permease subunit